MYTTLTEAFWYVVGLLRKHPAGRKAALITAVVFLALAGLAALLAAFEPFSQIPKNVFANVAAISAICGGIALFASLAAYLPEEAVPPFLYRREMEELREERDKIKERNPEGQKADLFDTVQLNLNEIREYCVLNKRQAWSSFAFGVFAILLGFATLLYGVWKFYEGTSTNLTVASLTSVSGLLIQFIGGTSLFMYRNSLRQGNFYFAHLVQMQDVMLAIKLCTETTDSEKKSALQGKVVEALLKRASSLPSLPANKDT
jgi:hypothetical protein